MKYVVVIAHRIFFDNSSKVGGIDQITSFLINQNKNIFFIEHPITGCNTSKVDALNFLPIFTYSIFSGKKVLLHLPDFSETRFDSKLLNSIYKLVTRLSCIYTDQIICVSRPMKELIKKWGINQDKVTLIPNSPSLTSIYPKTGPVSNPVRIVFTKSEISMEEYSFLSEIFDRLLDYDLDLSVTVIGKIPQKLTKGVPKGMRLTGLIPLEQNFTILHDSDIGLAIYLKPESFEKYADSLKIREYAAFGMPIVASPNVSTAIEGRDANAVLVASNEQEFVDSILRLTRNSILYRDMSQNARIWAQNNDKDKILNEFFSKNFKVL